MRPLSHRSHQSRIFQPIPWLVLVCFLQTLLIPQSFAKETLPELPPPAENEVSTSDFFTPSIHQRTKKVELDLPIAALLEVTSSSLPLSTLTDISDTLRYELKNSKKFLVYSRSEMQQVLNHTLHEEKVAVRQINQFVNQAKKLYDDFKFKAAAQVMQEAMKVVPLFDAAPNILHNISEAYLTQALILFALEKDEEAKVTFLNAAALDPIRNLEPYLYPPTVIERFNQAKKDFRRIQEESLRIESNPPVAEVFVEGKRQGTTPITLKNLPLGVQKIRIIKAGYDPWEKRLMIVSTGSNQYTNRVNANLNKIGSNVSLNALMGELISRKTLELQLSKMADIGKLLFADVTVAARIEKSKNEKGYDLFIAAVDSKSGLVLGKGYSSIAADLSNLHPRISSTLQEMFKRIAPQKFTDRIVVEPKGANYLASYSKKKPFYKRWYFYTILGVAVAGGAGGAAVLMSRSSPTGGTVSSSLTKEP